MVSLLVTVDVECDMPKWVVEARTTLRNLRGIPRFAALCERMGVRPTYLVTYPVATRPEGALFGDLHAGGGCEIGAHLHPWTTPPFEANESRLEAIHPSRLPASAMEAKLSVLTDAIEKRTGARPRSYRAGRFGLNGAGLQALERLGYRVDTSVTPLTDWRDEGGIDWRDAPDVPYFPDRQQPHRRGASPVLEVPVTAGWNRPLPACLGRWIAKAPRTLRLRGILDNPWAPVAKLYWLYPAQATDDEMCRLADVIVERGHPCLNVFFHSSELWPGESPYCRTEADVDRYLAVLERFFAYAINTLGAAPRTLSELCAHYLNEV